MILKSNPGLPAGIHRELVHVCALSDAVFGTLLEQEEKGDADVELLHLAESLSNTSLALLRDIGRVELLPEA